MNESALNTYHPGDQWIKACGFNEKLFLKHYTILVRLHAIGTPSTRQGPDRWLLEARTHAPRIASFLSPAPTRLALAAFPGEPDRRWSCKDLLGDGSRRKLESFYK